MYAACFGLVDEQSEILPGLFLTDESLGANRQKNRQSVVDLVVCCNAPVRAPRYLEHLHDEKVDAVYDSCASFCEALEKKINARQNARLRHLERMISGDAKEGGTSSVAAPPIVFEVEPQGGRVNRRPRSDETSVVDLPGIDSTFVINIPASDVPSFDMGPFLAEACHVLDMTCRTQPWWEWGRRTGRLPFGGTWERVFEGEGREEKPTDETDGAISSSMEGGDESLPPHAPPPLTLPARHQVHRASLSAGRALVHCFAGVSRSATIMASFLMRVSRLPVTDVIREMRAVLSCVSPNRGFMLQLERWDLCRYDPVAIVSGSDTLAASMRRALWGEAAAAATQPPPDTRRGLLLQGGRQREGDRDATTAAPAVLSSSGLESLRRMVRSMLLNPSDHEHDLVSLTSFLLTMCTDPADTTASMTGARLLRLLPLSFGAEMRLASEWQGYVDHPKLFVTYAKVMTRVAEAVQVVIAQVDDEQPEASGRGAGQLDESPAASEKTALATRRLELLRRLRAALLDLWALPVEMIWGASIGHPRATSEFLDGETQRRVASLHGGQRLLWGDGGEGDTVVAPPPATSDPDLDDEVCDFVAIAEVARASWSACLWEVTADPPPPLPMCWPRLGITSTRAVPLVARAADVLSLSSAAVSGHGELRNTASQGGGVPRAPTVTGGDPRAGGAPVHDGAERQRRAMISRMFAFATCPVVACIAASILGLHGRQRLRDCSDISVCIGGRVPRVSAIADDLCRLHEEEIEGAAALVSCLSKPRGATAPPLEDDRHRQRLFLCQAAIFSSLLDLIGLLSLQATTPGRGGGRSDDPAAAAAAGGWCGGDVPFDVLVFARVVDALKRHPLLAVASSSAAILRCTEAHRVADPIFADFAAVCRERWTFDEPPTGSQVPFGARVEGGRRFWVEGCLDDLTARCESDIVTAIAATVHHVFQHHTDASLRSDDVASQLDVIARETASACCRRPNQRHM